MKRRSFLGAVVAAAGATSLAAFAQPPAAQKRLGRLWPGKRDAVNQPFSTAFDARLHELGWIEGRNLVLIDRYAENNPDRYEPLARELVADKVDVIHAIFSSGVRAARKAAPGTPIVFSIVSDPVADGFVASLARPGGNITGASTREQELYPKRIQLVRELLPRAARVAILLDTPGPQGMSPEFQRSLKALGDAGRQLGFRVEFFSVASGNELGPVFDRMARERCDAVLVLTYLRLLGNDRQMLVEHAQRTGVPAIYPASFWVEQGGLMSYSQNITELGRRAADYVDKILRGARPADLPVEEPNVFELVINLKAVKALGLAIPQSLLLRADRVIE